MIKVNGKDYSWEEGLTVQKLLDKMNFSFPLIIVAINKRAVPAGEHTRTVIEDGDEIKVMHLTSGG